MWRAANIPSVALQYSMIENLIKTPDPFILVTSTFPSTMHAPLKQFRNMQKKPNLVTNTILPLQLCQHFGSNSSQRWLKIIRISKLWRAWSRIIWKKDSGFYVLTILSHILKPLDIFKTMKQRILVKRMMIFKWHELYRTALYVPFDLC